MTSKKQYLFYFIYFLILFLFFEFSFRAYFAVYRDNAIILLKPIHIIDNVYPNLIEVGEREVKADNNEIDILLLGGSVIHDAFGSIEIKLKDQLAAIYDCEINVDNLAVPGHTSLDSRNKFEYIEDQKYDLVFLYHGINEFRFNNCPKEVFKNDYSHIEFYNLINSQIIGLSEYSIIPYTLNRIYVTIQKYVFKKEMLPNTYIREEWVKYGNEIKTSIPFYENYEYVVNKAIKNKSIMLLSSFGYYRSEDEVVDSLKVVDTPYEELRIPPIIWGEKDDIVDGIKTHNELIVQVSDQFKGDYLKYIDLESQLTKDNNHFIDMCHLTELGSIQFVEFMMPAVKESLDRKFNCK